jgi:hypothetical protein
LLVAAALAGCGGGGATDNGKPALRWKQAPVLRTSPTGAHVLIGTVTNPSSHKLMLRATQLEVVDRRGRRMKASAVFSSTYVRSIYPHNGIGPTGPAQYPEAEQRRVGYLLVLEAGKTAPLTVSWKQRPRGPAAARIDYGSGSLPVTGAATGSVN